MRIVFFSLVAGNGFIYAQETKKKADPGQDKRDVLKKNYLKEVGIPDELINGKEYDFATSLSKPLLLYEKEKTGIVFTPTRRYDNLRLDYDTYIDQAVYTDMGRTIDFRFPQIALNRDIVIGFDLCFPGDTMHFRRLSFPAGKNMPKNGYYEICYEGASLGIIRHKTILTQHQGSKYYKYLPERYIKTDGKYFLIRSRRDLTAATGKYAKDISNYVRQTKIRIRKIDKNDLRSILSFYDSLLKSGDK